MKNYLICFALAAAPAWAGDLPDPITTPGTINPAVSQDTIEKTICVKGWTKTVRPVNKYTHGMKVYQLGVQADLKEYEEDHLIPLSLGGNPVDPKNLWPQAWEGQWGARVKDRLELKLQHLVCSHQLPLAEAQKAIAENWIKAYERFCPSREECPSYDEIHGGE